MVHFKKFFDSMELLRKICKEVKMHRKLWCPESMTIRQTEQLRWLKLKKHKTKVNCDVAIGKNCSFLAVIARDSAGKLIAVATFKATTMYPIMEEAEACWWSLYFDRARNYSQVVVEGDFFLSFVESINCLKLSSHWKIVFDIVTVDRVFLSFYFQ